MPSDVPTPQNSFAKFAAKSPATVSQPSTLLISPQPQNAPINQNVQAVSSPPPSTVVVEVATPQSAPEPKTPTAQPAVNTPNPPIKIELNISAAIPPASTQNLPQISLPNPQVAQSGIVVPNQPEPKPSLLKTLFHWGTFVSLIGVGIKGFFDCLYFITVEFQNFEDGLEKHRIETGLVSQLMLKASLLVFATALAIFFALQLTRPRGNKWLTIFCAAAVFLVSLLVLQYASTINVVDVFKVASPQLDEILL